MTHHTTRVEFPLDLDAEIAANVRAALIEDIGAGDLTAELVPAANHSIATVIVREPAVVCGIDWFNRCFAEIDPAIKITWHVKEGDHVGPDTLLCKLFPACASPRNTPYALAAAATIASRCGMPS